MHPCVRFVRTGQRILKHRCVRQVKQPNRNMGAVADEAFVRGQVPKHPKWWWHFSACITGGLVLWCGLMSYRHTYHVINTDPNPVNEQVAKWTDEELGIPPDEEDIYPPGYVPLKQR